MPTLRRACIAATVSAFALAGCTHAPSAAIRGGTTPSSAAPSSIETPASTETPAPAASDQALTAHLSDAQAGAGDQFAVSSSRPDPRGGRITRYTRSFHGIPVVGGDVAVRLDDRGAYRGLSNGLTRPLDVGTVPRLSPADALAKARTRFAGTVTAAGPKQPAPRLVIEASTGVGRLAWETVVVGVRPDGQTPSRLHVFTDARTGDVLTSWDAVHTDAATGKGHYNGAVAFDTHRDAAGFSLLDDRRGGSSVCDGRHSRPEELPFPCRPMTDADNAWGTGSVADPQSAAADVAYGTARTYDFYAEVFHRRGIFDDGRGLPAYVHVGNQLQNAAWIGDGVNVMVYGDGAHETDPWTELDIAAHEMTHGVTENSVPGGLLYDGEAGGLNEATSDIMGTTVEFWVNSPADPGDYEMGELLDLFGTGTPLRFMYDPARDGSSLGCWTPKAGEVDVHYSSGIGNHFFFDLAEGTGRSRYGTSPVCGGAPAVTGIGRDKAAQIWYRALTTYFTSNTDYRHARAYTLSATADLYGRCGTEYRAVRAAWTAVAVPGTDAC